MTLTDYLLSPERENAALGLQMAASLLTDEEIFNAVFEAFRVAYDEKNRLESEYEVHKAAFLLLDDDMLKLKSPAYNHPFAKGVNIKILHKFIYLSDDYFIHRSLKRLNLYPHLIVRPSSNEDMIIYCLLSPPTSNKYDNRTVQKIGYAFQYFGIVECDSASTLSGLRDGANFFKVMHKCFCL
jgi:hypothetical protein